MTAFFTLWGMGLATILAIHFINPQAFKSWRMPNIEVLKIDLTPWILLSAIAISGILGFICGAGISYDRFNKESQSIRSSAEFDKNKFIEEMKEEKINFHKNKGVRLEYIELLDVCPDPKEGK